MSVTEQFNQGQYQEVIDQLAGSSNADELKYKALAHQKLGQFEAAMEVWNVLIQRLPEIGEFYNERGVCKFNLRFKHSMADFDEAVKLEPDNPYFFACRAYVKDKLGDSEGAVEDYTKAHDLDPTDAITLNNLGLAEQKLGHTSKARDFFKQSNDLLGYEEKGLEVEEAQETPTEPDLSMRSRWREVRKMMSSWKEFKQFLKELRGRR